MLLQRWWLARGGRKGSLSCFLFFEEGATFLELQWPATCRGGGGWESEGLFSLFLSLYAILSRESLSRAVCVLLPSFIPVRWIERSFWNSVRWSERYFWNSTACARCSLVLGLVASGLGVGWGLVGRVLGGWLGGLPKLLKEWWSWGPTCWGRGVGSCGGGGLCFVSFYRSETE